jgi:exodeoxyribonuclease V beta subunit
MSMQQLSLADQPLLNGHVIEASAGTGKTYSIAALVTREIAENDDLRIGQILITTFTRAAAAELRDRVRQRLSDTAEQIEGTMPVDQFDPVVAKLLAQTDTHGAYIRRLRRAVVEFDTATVATIHAVCSKILTMAGMPTRDNDIDDLTEMYVSQVVNDRLVMDAVRGIVWDEHRVAACVHARLGAPTAQLWWDDADSAETSERLHMASAMVEECVQQVMSLTTHHPSYNDLVRRAESVLSSAEHASTARKFAERFRIAFVDEAQDTDDLQWRLFHHVFPVGTTASDGKLISVGDPKQAIYAFRGADVYAYLNNRDINNISTLDTNYRSDKPVIDALNMLFSQATLGNHIAYRPVTPSTTHQESLISGVKPVEFVDIQDVSNQGHLAQHTAKRILHLLAKGRITENGESVPIQPHHICVLVASKGAGHLIERELRYHRVPAVTSGTESVFSGETAENIRIILLALERVSHTGRVRRVATTPFFGYSLTDPRLFPSDMVEYTDESIRPNPDDVVLEIQDILAAWRIILNQKGVAALASAVTSHVDVMQRFARGPEGERRLTDFAHVMDLLHEASGGQPITASQALEYFESFTTVSSQSDVVARRVESDSDAVTVMTVHRAKGLEFPVVVIADLWKYRPYSQSDGVPMFYRNGERVIDIGWIDGEVSAQSVQAVNTHSAEERRRLLYVAMTRARHHLSVMWASQLANENVLADTLDLSVVGTQVPCVSSDSMADSQPWQGNSNTEQELHLAPRPQPVLPTFQRTSFSRITTQQMGNASSAYANDAPGEDEIMQMYAHSRRYGSAGTPTGVPMPLSRLVGGTHVGTVLHSVYENLDFAARPLRDEVQRVVQSLVQSTLLHNDVHSIVEGVHLSLLTPLGPLFSHVTLSDVQASQRSAELQFDMALSSASSGVLVSDVGKLLRSSLEQDDVLYHYSEQLSHSSFDIPLRGLITGSVDMVMNLGTDSTPRIFITDYKSNRLDTDSDTQLIDAYSPDRLVHAMEHHHYPLQALIYGAAMYRYLRWRRPSIDADASIAGIAYFFIRGMVGPETPTDESGNPSGVFTWSAPDGFWSKLSDTLAGDSR